MNNQLNSGQLAFLATAVNKQGGHIEAGQLAKLLGKQKGNLLRKLRGMFPEEQLFKMKNRSAICNGGNGARREVETYYLDKYTAGALAMAYDGMLGIAVLKAFEDALTGLQAVANATNLSDAKGVAAAHLQSAKERFKHSDDDSERETMRKALGQLRRRGY